MHGDGKSDRSVVAEKRSNKECGAPHSAESVEPSGLTKGNSFVQTKCRTQRRERFDMDNSKRARSEKSWTQPRASAYVEPANLQARWSGYGRRSDGKHSCPEQRLRVTT